MMTPHAIMHKRRPDGDTRTKQRSSGVQRQVLGDVQHVSLVYDDGVGIATLKETERMEGGREGGRERRM